MQIAYRPAVRRGQLLLCNGCCCGQDPKPGVPIEPMLRYFLQQRLVKHWNVTTTDCLGMCEVANVALVLDPTGQAFYFGRLAEGDYQELGAWLSCCKQLGKSLSVDSLPQRLAALQLYV